MRDRVWRGFQELPGPRSAAALRLMLGLSPYRVAMLAELSPAMVADFERGGLEFRYWHIVSRRLHHAFAALGGGWCEPDTHDGANCVYISGAGHKAATDRQAIEAALALMGHRARPPRRRVTLEALARKVARPLGMAAHKVRAELAGRRNLSPRVRDEAFRQLGRGRDGAGAYFRPAAKGGWREVGCDFAGCWW